MVGVGATAVALHDFWRYDSRTDEHAVRQRVLRTSGMRLSPGEDAPVADGELTRRPGDP